MVALGLSVGPASAEFFGCNDKPGQLLYSYSGTPSSFHDRNYSSNDSGYSSYGRSRTTNDYAAHSRYYRAGSRHVTYYRSRHYRNDR